MSVSLAKPLPSLAIQRVLAEAVSLIVQQDFSFYLPVVLPMQSGDESWLLHDVEPRTESASYRHQVTGEIVTFGWLDCTTCG